MHLHFPKAVMWAEFQSWHWLRIFCSFPLLPWLCRAQSTASPVPKHVAGQQLCASLSGNLSYLYFISSQKEEFERRWIQQQQPLLFFPSSLPWCGCGSHAPPSVTAFCAWRSAWKLARAGIRRGMEAMCLSGAGRLCHLIPGCCLQHLSRPPLACSVSSEVSLAFI